MLFIVTVNCYGVKAIGLANNGEKKGFKKQSWPRDLKCDICNNSYRCWSKNDLRKHQ